MGKILLFVGVAFMLGAIVMACAGGLISRSFLMTR